MARVRPDLSLRNKLNATHGMRRTPTYKIWGGMKQRCYNTLDKSYPRYGGRGIKVCDRWLASFQNFLEDMGTKPLGKSIGRIDNNGDYTPENCRWETAREQSNNRSSSRQLTLNGVTKTVKEWSREIGTSDKLILYRLKAGWSVAESLNPFKNHGYKRTSQERGQK